MTKEEFDLFVSGFEAGMRPSRKQIAALIAAHQAIQHATTAKTATWPDIQWVRIPGNGKDIQPFEMSATPITQAQWSAVMGTNPSYRKGDNLPVESVSWFEAVKFSEAIGARLPTEQEWEWASLGGGTSDPYGPIDEIAWTYENSDRQTHPVGLKKPNGYGLFDTLGNVWEWTDSEERGCRVNRGGCFNSLAAFVRSAFRDWFVPSFRYGLLGFRCVRGVGGKP